MGRTPSLQGNWFSEGLIGVSKCDSGPWVRSLFQCDWKEHWGGWKLCFQGGSGRIKLELCGRWESLHLLQPPAEAAHRLHLRDNMHLVLRREESP